MKIRFEAELTEAVQYEIDMNRGVREYAIQFLLLTNNAREWPAHFYKVENTAGNNVYVTCAKESAESVKDFLQGAGCKITDKRKVLVCRPEYVYNRKTDDMINEMFLDNEDLWDLVMLAPEELA